ncbi:hypothetical protein DLM86_00710 [Paenibacillus flagellatus]|uniref:Uncharacterized protein n=2 Tax=Paenibacillus flagellatus TaxID=2211139 RepID=A0A2V5KDJ7_9BACL|nr:hypothetical protein DLM86_00710 [Paenibacillus flagellatus]
MVRDDILREAIDGTGCTPEWAALQTIRLFRHYEDAGLSHDDALAAAKVEMQAIAAEALRIRRRERFQTTVAPWCVIVLGTMACVGWWALWE